MPDQDPATATSEASEAPDDFNEYQEFRDKEEHAEPSGVSAAEPAVEPETAVESETAEPTEEQEDEETEPVAEEEEAEPGKKPGNMQKRFNKLHREKRELEERLAALEKAKPVEAVSPEAEPSKGEPQVDAFTTYEEYSKALIKWELDNRDRARADEDQKAAARREHDEIRKVFHARANAVKETIPDWSEVMEAADLILPNHIIDALYESPDGPQVAYHLASNPDEAKRIAALSPANSLLALGKLEGSLAAKRASPTPKPKPAVTSAPSPVKPITGGKAAAASASNADGSDYNSWEQQRERELRNRKN